MLAYILVISQLLFVLKANLIASGNGVSVAGRLNRGSLSSTVIKTQQQLNEDDQQRNLNQSPDLSTSFDDIEKFYNDNCDNIAFNRFSDERLNEYFEIRY